VRVTSFDICLNRLAVSIVVVAACQLAAAQGPNVGKLSAARNAKVSKGAYSASGEFVEAKKGQAVREGQGIRTFRRSYAEITFTDGSIIRVNEQTDLVIQSVATMRRVRLEKGALWVKDEKGSKTTVQTPVATATARGTEFIITDEGTCSVKEGEVDLEAAGLTITIGPGEVGYVGPSGTPTKAPLGDPGVPNDPKTGDGKENPWYDGTPSQPPIPSLLSLGAISGVLGIAGGMDGGSRTPTAVVPEPATMAALALGGAWLIARRRK
jgi:hypothetical protein